MCDMQSLTERHGDDHRQNNVKLYGSNELKLITNNDCCEPKLTIIVMLEAVILL
jgi:hypothetical protein